MPIETRTVAGKRGSVQREFYAACSATDTVFAPPASCGGIRPLNFEEEAFDACHKMPKLADKGSKTGYNNADQIGALLGAISPCRHNSNEFRWGQYVLF